MEGKEIPMEVDTGAGVSIIPFSTWRSHFPDLPLQSSAIQLKTNTNEKLSVLGQHDVTVRYGDQVQKLMITVVDGDSTSLLGRDWLKQLRLNWTQQKVPFFQLLVFSVAEGMVEMLDTAIGAVNGIEGLCFTLAATCGMVFLFTFILYCLAKVPALVEAEVVPAILIEHWLILAPP